MKGWNTQKDKTTSKYEYKEKEEVNTDNNISTVKDLKISNQMIEKFLNDDEEDGKVKSKPKKALRCTKCPGSEFYDQDEHRKHFKSNWHNFNVKLNAKGKESLTAEEYDEFVLMNPEALK
jgi:hypothetical protein